MDDPFPDLPFRFPFLTSNDIVLCTLLNAVYTMFTKSRNGFKVLIALQFKLLASTF